jgi:hypothetical protein
MTNQRRDGSGRVRRLLALVALVALPGCYSYREVPAAAPVAPGAQVRVHLEPASVERLRQRLVRPDTLVEGLVVARTEAALELDAFGMSWPPGTVAPPLTQRLTLAPTDLTRVEVRRLDVGRTAGAVLGGGLVAGLLVNRLFGIAGGSSSGGEGGGPDNSRGWLLPLVSIRP